MGGLAVFDRKEVHRVLISAAIFKKAASHQVLEQLVRAYLKKSYKDYNLLEIDSDGGFAVCEKGEIPDE